MLYGDFGTHFMLLESLIVSICLGGLDGCSQSARAYYLTNDTLKTWAKEKKQMLKEEAKGKEELVAFLGFGYIALGGSITMKINKNLSARLDKENAELRYTIVF